MLSSSQRPRELLNLWVIQAQLLPPLHLEIFREDRIQLHHVFDVMLHLDDLHLLRLLPHLLNLLHLLGWLYLGRLPSSASHEAGL